MTDLSLIKTELEHIKAAVSELVTRFEAFEAANETFREKLNLGARVAFAVALAEKNAALEAENKALKEGFAANSEWQSISKLEQMLAAAAILHRSKNDALEAENKLLTGALEARQVDLDDARTQLETQAEELRGIEALKKRINELESAHCRAGFMI